MFPLLLRGIWKGYFRQSIPQKEACDESCLVAQTGAINPDPEQHWEGKG